MRITIRGAVQGVGFRPFVFGLAKELGLTGWVRNTLGGVSIEAEGTAAQLEAFLLRLDREKPPRSSVHSLESSFLSPVGYRDFSIEASDLSGPAMTTIMPDIAACPECIREIFTAGARRYRYPFTNCTNCGPRFSIIEALPYDRPHTSLRDFVLCPDCRAEYDDPRDRRFHAQPIACPACGPHLELWDNRGRLLAGHDEALQAAGQALREGQIVAVKGLGGFQLLTDARSQQAVQCLRDRKHREEKPLAVLYPTLAMAARDCRISPLEARLLASPEAPIVLLQKALPSVRPSSIAPGVAPGNPCLGVMLPYTPLHHLLMADLGFPIVATSGNLADEPICLDEHEALERLGLIADLFLVHNRPIVRQVDDSLTRIMMGREIVLRRARGYAPLPIRLPAALPALLALGGNQKNAIALVNGREALVSQHIGDLESLPAFTAFRRAIDDLSRLYEIRPQAVACDAHPDYLSTRHAAALGLPLIPVQHHLAHVLSCRAENELAGPVLGVAWDGAGYGDDGTIWGGEFLSVEPEQVCRVAHLRPFPLPGGDKAAKEPRRAALGMLFAIYGSPLFDREDLVLLRSFSPPERATLNTMLTRGLNSPPTTSMGRLFDGVAALAGLCERVSFEGQAALALESALGGLETDASYPLDLCSEASPALLDWEPLVEEVLADVARGAAGGLIAAKFHNALVEAIVAVARLVDIEQVVLTGGCFQNKYLTERAVIRLRAAGFLPYWHQRVPPNDGGLALGQLVAAAHGKAWHYVSGNTRSDS